MTTIIFQNLLWITWHLLNFYIISLMGIKCLKKIHLNKASSITTLLKKWSTITIETVKPDIFPQSKAFPSLRRRSHLPKLYVSKIYSMTLPSEFLPSLILPISSKMKLWTYFVIYWCYIRLVVTKCHRIGRHILRFKR